MILFHFLETCCTFYYCFLALYLWILLLFAYVSFGENSTFLISDVVVIQLCHSEQYIAVRWGCMSSYCGPFWFLL